jgi:hypothetical protein
LSAAILATSLMATRMEVVEFMDELKAEPELVAK